MLQSKKIQTNNIMIEKKPSTKHYYILTDGTIVYSQKEGCDILKIGRNAFRNRIKNGSIEKVLIENRPKGYDKEPKSALR